MGRGMNRDTGRDMSRDKGRDVGMDRRDPRNHDMDYRNRGGNDFWQGDPRVRRGPPQGKYYPLITMNLHARTCMSEYSNELDM